jgi:phosphatidylglycerol:prolipoprotein diacylglycerol transferase
VLDTCAPFVPIGMAFGRIGCWLNGCCWGWRCAGAVPPVLSRFAPNSPVHGHQVALGFIEGTGRTLPVHPVQLYDCAHSFLLFGLVWWYLRRDPPPGATTCLFLGLYGVGRFCLETLRGDHRYTLTGLTVAQNLMLLLIVGGFTGLVLSHRLSLRRLKAADVASH